MLSVIVEIRFGNSKLQNRCKSKRNEQEQLDKLFLLLR